MRLGDVVDVDADHGLTQAARDLGDHVGVVVERDGLDGSALDGCGARAHRDASDDPGCIGGIHLDVGDRQVARVLERAAESQYPRGVVLELIALGALSAR